MRTSGRNGERSGGRHSPCREKDKADTRGSAGTGEETTTHVRNKQSRRGGRGDERDTVVVEQTIGRERKDAGN